MDAPTCGVPHPPMGGNMRIKLELKSYDPCPVHGPSGESCNCEKKMTGEFVKEEDLATKQLAQFIQALILGSTQSITDVTNVSNSVANGTATTAPTIVAGTGGTAAAVTDVALVSQTETVGATVNAFSGAGVSGSFTVTGTITATAARAYQEVGLRITCATFLYLLCRDVFTTLNVSNGGTLAVTYTISFG